MISAIRYPPGSSVVVSNDQRNTVAKVSAGDAKPKVCLGRVFRRNAI
jgi:hypothetical protein